jgi:hypothetical protein
MNKLIEYRDEVAHYGENKLLNDPIDEAFTKGFKEGWDAQGELDLPVKFYDWFVSWKVFELAKWSEKYGDKLTEFQDRKAWVAITHRDTKEAYKYWIENIYEP